jgi:hypothetical protein
MPPPPVLPRPTISAPLELIATVPTAKPVIDLRQNAAQSNVYVTLSITRDYTTYTTVILLAGTETPNPTPASGTITITSAITSNPQYTTAPDGASNGLPPGTTSSDPRSDVIIGAIVGSVLGTFAIVALIWCCFYQRISASARLSTGSSDSGSSGSSDAAPRRVRVEEVRRVRVQEVRETTRATRGVRTGGIFSSYRRPQVDDD